MADPGTTISNLNVAASWFEIDDATIGSYGWNNPSPLPSHVTFRNITTTSEVFMKGGSDISIIGGSVGGFCSNGAPTAMHIEGEIASGVTMTNVLVQGVLFHDVSRCPSTDHYETIRIDENASNVTIRGNRFVHDDPNTSSIFITNTSGGPATRTTSRSRTTSSGRPRTPTTRSRHKCRGSRPASTSRSATTASPSRR